MNLVELTGNESGSESQQTNERKSNMSEKKSRGSVVKPANKSNLMRAEGLKEVLFHFRAFT